MFWKKQQPALRMVKGNFHPIHTQVLRLVINKSHTTHSRFIVEWNGEPFSMYFDGFGSITVQTTLYTTLPHMRAVQLQYDSIDGLRTILHTDMYHRYMNLDALEQHVREHTRDRFAAHGIDSQSYSLYELRIVGYGMERGWKLREEYCEGAS